MQPKSRNFSEARVTKYKRLASIKKTAVSDNFFSIFSLIRLAIGNMATRILCNENQRKSYAEQDSKPVVFVKIQTQPTFLTYCVSRNNRNDIVKGIIRNGFG